MFFGKFSDAHPWHFHLGLLARVLHCRKQFLGIIAAALLVLCPPAQAATTTGTAANGQTMWNDSVHYGCSACHGTPDQWTPAALDGSNAGNVVRYMAVSTTMATGYASAVVMTTTQANDIAAYIATFTNAPLSASAVATTVANTTAATTAYNTATSAIVTNITVDSYPGGSSAYPGVIDSMGAVTAPAKGTLSYTLVDAVSGATVNFTGAPPASTYGVVNIVYTPTTGACGADSFSYNGIASTGTMGTTSARTVSMTIGPPPAPVISSGATASGTVGIAGTQYTTTVSNAPSPTLCGAVRYSATNVGYGGVYTTTTTGWPAGVSLNTSTGAISGTPTTAGTYTIVVYAFDPGGGAGKTITFTVSQPAPTVSSLNPAGGPAAGGTSVIITGTNFTGSGYNATAVKFGTATATFTVNSATQITATAPAGTNGTAVDVTVTTTATTGGAPVFTSAVNAGDLYSYGVTVTAVSPSSGPAAGGTSVTITGQNLTGATAVKFGATAATAFTVNSATQITATAPAGTSNSTVDVTVTAPGGTSATSALDKYTYLIPPVITSPTTAGGSSGYAMSYQITANNLPASYGATGLPPGLAVNPTTGLISGIPTTVGTYNATVSATNAVGTGSQAVTFTIALGVPVITSPLTASGSGGSAFAYAITASSNPTSYNATGLPPGLAVNTTTGVISGTPTANGTYPVNISATNASGTGSAALTITLSAVTAPVITSAATASGLAGTPFSYQITATNVPTGYNATGLPVGLTVNTTTGVISGATNSSGSFAVTISATNAAGTGSSTLTINISLTPPTANAAAMTVQLNTATTLDLTAYISGASATGVGVAVAPKHGTATVNGMKVTYTPVPDYFGADTFRYVAYGVGGTSQPATVTVTIVGRPDPTRNANVTGLINLQSETAKRFRQTQMVNFQQRLESRHHAAPAEHGSDIASKTKMMSMVGDIESLGMENPPSADSSSARANIQTNVPARALPGNEPGQNTSPGLASSVLLARTAISLLTTSSVNLNLATLVNNGSKPTSDAASLQIWGAGNLRIGSRNQPGGGANVDYTTDGISLGADRRFGEQLTLGVGIGYARDKSTLGTDGTGSASRGDSIAAYASYQASPTMFVDGLLGYGSLSMNTTRYVAPINDFARSTRSGSQEFGSLATGYEYRDEGLLLSPYVRYDMAVDRLKATTETGAGLYALNYAGQATRSRQEALGFRAESQHQIDSGTVQPRARIEYQHHIEGANQTSIAYADLINTRYNLTTPSSSSNAWLFGMGSGFDLRRGLNLDFEYQRQHSSGPGNSQAFRFNLSKRLD